MHAEHSNNIDLPNQRYKPRMFVLIHQTTRHYRAANPDQIITDVRCDGSERMIQECSYRRMRANETCYRNYRAGVVCTDSRYRPMWFTHGQITGRILPVGHSVLLPWIQTFLSLIHEIVFNYNNRITINDNDLTTMRCFLTKRT